MRFDNVLQTLLQSLGKGDTVEEGMRSVIDACTRMRPHPDWNTFSEIDFRNEPNDLRTWILGISNDFPPNDRLAGLFFGLFTFHDETSDEELTDLVLAGTTDYKPDDSTWVESTRELWDSWGPFEAQSEVLRTICRRAYATDDALENDAEYPLCLAYSTLAVTHALSEVTVRSISKTRDRLGVAVGFHDGDILILGELTTSGLVLNPRF